MHRAVRFLRIALPIAFVAFVILIGLSYSGRYVKARPASEPVISPIRKEQPKQVAFDFEDTQTVGGKVLTRVRARRVMGFESKWFTLEDVELTIFRENNRTYTLRAPQAEVHAETRAAEVKKGVQLSSSTGIQVQTEEMKFDGNRLVNDIPLSFSAQKWTGKAGGIDLNLASEEMRLVGGVEATMQSPAPGEPPLLVNAKSAEFFQPEGEVTFREDVKIIRAGDVIKNEAVTAKLDQAREVMVELHGCCKVEMSLAANSAMLPKELGQGSTVIRAERFTTDLGAQGEIHAITALGMPTRTEFQGPPRRDLTATTLRISLAGPRVSEIRAEGAATLTEQAATGARQFHANYLTLYLDPATRKVSSAVAQESIRYRDPRNSATGQRANYDFATELLVLSTVGDSMPALTTDGHTLRANSIEFLQKDRLLKAQGTVSTQLSSREDGVTASETGLFPKEDGPVFVNSDSLVLRQNEKVGVFNGNVRAWQGNNVITSASLQLEAAGESVNARGDVRVLLYNVRGEKREKPIVTRSNTLLAKRSERRINLDGNVKIEDEPRTLSADRAVIFLDATRRIERVEANANIVVTEKSTGRRATGTRAVYRLTEKTLNLDGTPAVVTEPRGTVKGTQILFDIARNKVNVISDGSEATYHPQ